MNKSELVDELAEEDGFTKKDSKKLLEAVLEIITKRLKENEEVLLTGFGKFEVRARQATEKLDPRTGEEIHVPAKVAPKFKKGKNLKETIQENLKAVDDGSGELEIEKA